MIDSMTIPNGLTCGDCRMYPKCENIIGVKPDTVECDFFPVAFVASSAKFAEYKRDLTAATERADKAEAEVKRLREALERFARIDLTGPVGDAIAWDILNARAALRPAGEEGQS